MGDFVRKDEYMSRVLVLLLKYQEKTEIKARIQNNYNSGILLREEEGLSPTPLTNTLCSAVLFHSLELSFLIVLLYRSQIALLLCHLIQ